MDRMTACRIFKTTATDGFVMTVGRAAVASWVAGRLESGPGSLEAKMLSLSADGPIDYTLLPKKLPSRQQMSRLTAKVKAAAAKLEPGTREP